MPRFCCRFCVNECLRSACFDTFRAVGVELDGFPGVTAFGTRIILLRHHVDGTHSRTVGCAGFAIEHLPREHDAWNTDNFGFCIEAMVLSVHHLGFEFANVATLWTCRAVILHTVAMNTMFLLGSEQSPFRLAAFRSHGQQHRDQRQHAG